MPVPRTERPDVELRLPADGAYVSVLRTLTAGLAARLDFLMDDIEDLRVAVGEACAMVLGVANADGDLTARFYLGQGELTVAVAVTAEAPSEPDQDSFAWQVLSTLASSATAEVSDDEFEVTLTLTAGGPALPADAAGL